MWPFKIILTSLKKNNYGHSHRLWMSTKASGHEEKNTTTTMRVGKRQNSMEIKVVVNLHPYFPLLFWKDFFIFLHWKSLTLGSTQIGVFEEHATSVNPEVLWNQEDFPQLTNSKERREKTEKPNILWHPGCFRRFLVQRLGAWYSIWILKVGAKLKGCNGYRRPSMYLCWVSIGPC